MPDIRLGESAIPMFIFEKKKCFDNLLPYKGDKINSPAVATSRI